ncbi:16S rRNA (cytidine(1402)-2'-O)-methyltransferase [Acidithiobacillus sp. IBUN Pt1247-S3]|uniref:16S rRNA (cytidine(1402)-2'-O)-methyltransferase n=1 Tax=Acidithiobacillus sp. IBUN Pt1247-S3 TaxID=3166642 RepID=UPI0034E503D8
MTKMPVEQGTHAGRLDIVGTPIGNLEDLSPRARRVLSAADRILVEDRRHAQRLFQSIGIQPRTEPLHEHNEREQIPRILAYLQAGERLALISDAGMPLVSDPGYPLVSALRRAGVEIAVVPGPSASLAALSLAGLPTDRFCFEGFLPAKSGARQQRLQELVDETRSMIFYEAPHRILATLQDMIAAFSSERGAVLARELTKLHEESIGETLDNILTTLAAAPERQRGEMCLVLAGAPARESGEAELDRLLRPLLAELPLAQAVRIAEAQCDVAHRRLYQRALALTSTTESD